MSSSYNKYAYYKAEKSTYTFTTRPLALYEFCCFASLME